MPLPRALKRLVDRALARWGFERVPTRLVYPWQRSPVDLPSHSGSPLPEGARALSPDHPRLLELARRYREIDSVLARDPVWTEELLAGADLRHFRGDNPYVWQLRGRNLNELGYALSYYCVRRFDRLGLLDRLDEDGHFGVHTFEIDGRSISRDLLDSVLELDFLDRHLGISGSSAPGRSTPLGRSGAWTLLDIGAGYGRLAHRAVTAFPESLRCLCTDAIALSTFLSEFYLGFRGVGQRATVVPLDELETAIPPGAVDIAVNVHSFSECSLAAIDAWLAFLAGRRVPHLMVVPNAASPDGRSPLTNAGEDFGPLVRRHGYVLTAVEPKFPDPVVQEYGISPASYFLFRHES